MLKHPWRQVFIDNAGLDTPDRWIWRLADVERMPPSRASATSRRLQMASSASDQDIYSDAVLQKPNSQQKQFTRASGDDPTSKESQFMFNVDLALVREFEHELDASSGFVACSVLPSPDGAVPGKASSVCRESATFNKVTLHQCIPGGLCYECIWDGVTPQGKQTAYNFLEAHLLIPMLPPWCGLSCSI